MSKKPDTDQENAYCWKNNLPAKATVALVRKLHGIRPTTGTLLDARAWERRAIESRIKRILAR